VLKWDGYAHELAHRWHRRTHGTEFEDVLQSVRIGFMVAAQRYNPALGEYSTYATQWGNNYARRFCQKEGRGGVYVPINVGFLKLPVLSLDLGGDDTRTLAETIPERETEHTRPVFGPDFWPAVEACLPERLARIIRLRFWERKTLREIAGVFGITRERTRQLEVKGLALIRKRHPEFAGFID
jgi:RNA polymerase sigma factor (sigma-70 family)